MAQDTIRVLLFSVLRDIVGGDSVEVELSEGDTIADLLAGLYTRFPDLADWDGKIRVAADLQYVDRDHAIAPGQEIAIMPPVQGG